MMNIYYITKQLIKISILSFTKVKAREFSRHSNRYFFNFSSRILKIF